MRPTDQPPDFAYSIEPFALLLLIGFVVAGLGHLYNLRSVIVLGILLILSALFLVPVYLQFFR